MKLTQNQKARFIGASIKLGAIVAFSTLVGYLLYNVATSEKVSRERAIKYEREKGKKKPYNFIHN